MTRQKQRGFTLIELIVLIVLVGIAASFMAMFMQTRISNAPDVLVTSQEEATAERVMERIMADYLVEINGTTPENALATLVTNNTGGVYTALGAAVSMAYITFDGTGAEQLSASPTTTLKVTVDVNGQNTKVTLLTTARTNAGAAADTEAENNY